MFMATSCVPVEPGEKSAVLFSRSGCTRKEKILLRSPEDWAQSEFKDLFKSGATEDKCGKSSFAFKLVQFACISPIKTSTNDPEMTPNDPLLNRGFYVV